MKNNYDKHQREYTVLGSSVIANYFYSKEAMDFFSCNAKNPIYFLIEDDVFYHLFSKSDYATWPISYFKKYSKQEFFAYVEANLEMLENYRMFMKKDHVDVLDSLEVLHKGMRDLIGVILVTVYAPDYVENLSQDVLALCAKAREKLEDIHKIGMSLQEKLLNKLEKENGIEADLLKNLTEGEYLEFIKNKKLPEDIKERKKFFFIGIDSKGDHIYSKKEADEILDKIDETRNIDLNQKEIKGQTAFAGKVQGKVVNIRKIEEADSVQEGDIIVASMTDPRYVPAMKKAAAFVTDEGGILCHAAIVSREMKKPCVIGTKIATQVLRDGDQVEVDADNGIVKKI